MFLRFPPPFFLLGKVFDSSYDRGVPLNMIVGDAGVKGWDDGVYKACVGEVRVREESISSKR